MFHITRVIPRRIKLKLKSLLNKPDMELSLRGLRKNGFRPTRTIDVGAYKGEATRIIKRVFPETAVLMIEPRQDNNLYLKRICQDYPDCQYINTLVGAIEKEKANFFINGPYSQVVTEGRNDEKRYIQLSMTTLDKLTAQRYFLRPHFLKLDVEHYELEVLKGAKSIMNTVEVIIMEISFIQNCVTPAFYDTVKFMNEYGFCLYDICTFFYRPKNNGLWQIDAIFVKKKSPLLASDSQN